jgi:hypothetical protein
MASWAAGFAGAAEGYASAMASSYGAMSGTNSSANNGCNIHHLNINQGIGHRSHHWNGCSNHDPSLRDASYRDAKQPFMTTSELLHGSRSRRDK